jgi:MFS family permease
VKIFEPLRHRAFRTVWLGMAVSLVGDGVFLVAVAWQAYLLSDAPSALGMTMAAMSVPQIALLLVGGAISDRFQRRHVLIGADLVRGLAVAALGALSLAGALTLGEMAALAAIYGAGSAFFGPAFDALVPELVPEEALTQANAIDQLVRPVAGRLVGPALGGWVVAASDPGWGFLFDAATFAVSIGCLLGLGPTAAPPAEEEGGSLVGEIRAGFEFVRTRVWLWGTFSAATVAYLLFLGPSEVLLPYVVKNELHGTAADLGTVFACGGVGAVVASLAMAQRGLPARNMTFIYASWTLSTLSIIGYGLAVAPWQVMVACLAYNLLESAGQVVWLTTKQQLVPARLLGRVSSLDWFVSVGMMPLSYALAGPVADALGARTTLVAGGAIGAVVTLGFLFVPGMRAPERTTSTA